MQYLYTTVDTLVIGNYCGKTSLAAVGTSAQPLEVLLCIFDRLRKGYIKIPVISGMVTPADM